MQPGPAFEFYFDDNEFIPWSAVIDGADDYVNITCLFALKHTPKIDAVQIAARASGKELSLTML